MRAGCAALILFMLRSRRQETTRRELFAGCGLCAAGWGEAHVNQDGEMLASDGVEILRIGADVFCVGGVRRLGKRRALKICSGALSAVVSFSRVGHLTIFVLNDGRPVRGVNSLHQLRKIIADYFRGAGGQKCVAAAAGIWIVENKSGLVRDAVNHGWAVHRTGIGFTRRFVHVAIHAS